MSRSSKKGPYVDPRLLKKIEGKKPDQVKLIKTWSRACMISPEMVGFVFGVHNGRDFIEVRPTEDMVGHRLGEFSPTRKFVRHGGKMQKELEVKKKEAELAAAKAAKETADGCFCSRSFLKHNTCICRIAACIPDFHANLKQNDSK